MAFGSCARIVASAQHRIRTLTVRQDALVLVLHGRKQLLTADEQLEAGCGHGVLIAGGTTWDVINDPRGDGRYEALALAFDEELVHAFHKDMPQGASKALDAACVLSMDGELGDAVRRTLPQRPVSDTVMRHRMWEVLLLVHEQGHHFVPGGSLSWADRIRRLVAQRPHADWKVDALGQAFHMSESSLRRRLESEGFTVSALVREVRLETALGLLQTTSLPVGEVAQRCGWESHSRFSAAFQERWGFAPSVLRGRALSKDAATELA